MEIRQRPDAGTRPAPETSPAGAATMRVVGATAIALAASMAIQNAMFVWTVPPAFGDPIEEVLAWHAENRVRARRDMSFNICFVRGMALATRTEN